MVALFTVKILLKFRIVQRKIIGKKHTRNECVTETKRKSRCGEYT